MTNEQREAKLSLNLISERLLQDDLQPLALWKAVEDYSSLLSGKLHLDNTEKDLVQNLSLDEGVSLSTNGAAQCLKDTFRTHAFIRGLCKAVQAASVRFPDTAIHVLYAGTGPFAALALPLTTRFLPEQLQFSFLEIQEQSLKLLEHTIDRFDLGRYVRSIHAIDACRYAPPAGEVFHILLTETMQRALRKEPQVAITRHLAPLIQPGGFLVPQEIEVSAALVHDKNLSDAAMGAAIPEEDFRCALGTLLRFSLDTFRLPDTEQIMALSAEKLRKMTRLVLRTQIRVFDDVILPHDASGLTISENVCTVESHNRLPVQVGFRYVGGKTPGFVHRLIYPEAANSPAI